MTTTPTKNPSTRRGAKVLAVGVVAACAIACSLPALLGVGALGTIGAFAGGWWIAGLVALVAVGAAVAWLLVRRSRSAAAAGCGDTCSCGGC